MKGAERKAREKIRQGLDPIILHVRAGVMDEENDVFPLRYMHKDERKGLSL